MKTLITSAFCVFTFGAMANKITRIQYIEQWKDVAQQNMREYKIPASIILAQGIIESGSGNSDLALQANNHFGIKCHSTWTGEKYFKDDDAKDECFRSYAQATESYRDHALFLTSGKRYETLFALDITDYSSWAHGLKKAGYATHPEYAQKLIKVIEENQLHKFDNPDVLTQPGMKPNVPLSRPKKPGSEESITIGLQTSSINKVQCVVVQQGQTLYKISKESGVSLRQLYKYNDFEEGKEALTAGEIVYLQPKRMKSGEKKTITTQDNQTTLRQLSQKHGVKLKTLMRKNGIENPDSPLKAKTRIKL